MSENPINVLYIFPMSRLEEECVRQIESVSPRIKVHDASRFAVAEDKGDYSSKEQFDAILAEAEVLFAFRPPQDVIARAPGLKWIQTPITGADPVLIPEVVESSVIVTNARGIHGTQGSEMVFAQMLMLAKKASLLLEMKQEKAWKNFVPELLNGKTLGCLGLGAIGVEIVRLAKAFGMRVVATRAHPEVPCEYADEILPSSRINEVLAQSDFVVVAMPLTPESEKLIGEAQLRAMKPGAYLINISRGKILDEDDLIRALKEKWIAGAALDTFTVEPLPVESELWDLPNVILSPHIMGRRSDYNMLATNLFSENLKHYVNGTQMFNVVDKKRGY
ncbi:D-2-hydroxyacid dehydrogenase [Chloroflexota bacterium]